MGRASRNKTERRRRSTAEFSVFCPGVLEVLSIGKGDLKLVLDGSSPEDVEKARSVIEEMLRKGYSIFVETDKGPTRVKRFNPKRMTYLITEVAEEEPEAGAEPAKPARRKRERHVPVAGSRATAVGRTAGGQGPSPTGVGHFTIREPRNSIVPLVGDSVRVGEGTGGFVLATLTAVQLNPDDPAYVDLTWRIEGDVVVGSMTLKPTEP